MLVNLKKVSMRIYIMIMVTCVLFMVTGCQKEEFIYPKGDIVGFIDMVDRYGNELDDKSGVSVSIDGTDIKTITNELGRYKLTDVPVGTYKIIYKRSDFGALVIESYQFVGGDVPAFIYPQTIYQQSDVEVINADISISEKEIIISGVLSKSESLRYLVCISKQEDVSYLNYDFAFRGYWTNRESEFQVYEIADDKFYNENDKVYVMIYSVNPHESYGYYNHTIQDYVYTSLKQAYDLQEVLVEKAE